MLLLLLLQSIVHLACLSVYYGRCQAKCFASARIFRNLIIFVPLQEICTAVFCCAFLQMRWVLGDPLDEVPGRRARK